MIEEIADGRATATLKVEPELGNSWGTLHGGAIMSLVDVMGTLALLSVDHTRGGVSVEMNTSFMAAAPEGATLKLEGSVLKAGKTLGFTDVRMWTRREDGREVDVARGRHTKAL